MPHKSLQERKRYRQQYIERNRKKINEKQNTRRALERSQVKEGIKTRTPAALRRKKASLGIKPPPVGEVVPEDVETGTEVCDICRRPSMDFVCEFCEAKTDTQASSRLAFETREVFFLSNGRTTWRHVARACGVSMTGARTKLGRIREYLEKNNVPHKVFFSSEDVESPEYMQRENKGSLVVCLKLEDLPK